MGDSRNGLLSVRETISVQSPGHLNQDEKLLFSFLSFNSVAILHIHPGGMPLEHIDNGDINNAF